MNSATYNTNGTIATATDVNGTVTTYAYNGTGGCNRLLPTSATVGGLTTARTWNCNGGVATSTTDPNGQTTTTDYGSDPFWRPVSVTDPTGANTGFVYQPNDSYQFPTMIAGIMSFGNSIVDHVLYMDSLCHPMSNQRLQAPGGSTLDTISYTYDTNGWPVLLSAGGAPCWKTDT